MLQHVLDKNEHNAMICVPIEYTTHASGADPGFLERGVHMYKCVGVRFALIVLKYTMKMK